MVIGSGLIGNAFLSISAALKDICIFASGVSNSNCTNVAEFKREEDLLLKSLINFENKLFLYFSTCSIYGSENHQSQYIRHKLLMESHVKLHKNFLIIRLPQIAGKTDNQNTLLNFLANKIQSNQSFEIWVNAYRNIIDISDVVKIVEKMIEDKTFRNNIVNIANPISHKVTDVVQELENVLGSKATFKALQKGEYVHIDLSLTEKYINSAHIEFSSNYLSEIIKKYFYKSI